MALKAFFRVFGFWKNKDEDKDDKSSDGAKDDKNHPNQKALPRRHPYDEITDEEVETMTKNKTQKTPRVHPYDEVSDAVLEANRNNRPAPARRHNYDEVDLERTMSKKTPTPPTADDGATVKGSNSATPSLNYVEVDIQPGLRTGSSKPRSAQAPSTVYSEVLTGVSQDKIVIRD